MVKPQSVFDWRGGWNPPENANFQSGSTHPNLASSNRAQVFGEEGVDDKERKEEEDTDTNIRRRRGKLMNNKVDPDIPLFPWKKRYCLESASVFQPLFGRMTSLNYCSCIHFVSSTRAQAG